MTSKLKEGVMQGVFTLCACVSILAVALICIFLFANGVPTLFKIGPLKFLLGTTWKPGNDIFGILPMILGSIYVTAGAILVGETAALIYTASSVAKIPSSLFSSTRTLAVHMYLLSNEGLYIGQTYGTAVVLLVLVLVINGLSGLVAGKLAKR